MTSKDVVSDLYGDEQALHIVMHDILDGTCVGGQFVLIDRR